MIIISKWLINGTDVETVILLHKKHITPNDYVKIGVDAEEYYRMRLMAILSPTDKWGTKTEYARLRN